MDIGQGLPWAVVLAAFAYSGWLHAELRKLYIAKAELAKDVQALEESGTIGTILEAINEIKAMQRTMAVRIDADYHRIALCLISMSRGDKVSMADLARPAT